MMHGLVPLSQGLSCRDRSRLTITSDDSDVFDTGKVPVTVQMWDGDCVPRYYAYEESREDFRRYMTRFWDPGEGHSNLIFTPGFTKPLREYQEDPVATFVEAVTNVYGPRSGIFQAPCGAGKTVMALNVISRIKLPTMIVVHSEYLMEQWLMRIDEFLNVPEGQVGRLYGKTVDLKPITIGMMQSLSKKEYSEEVCKYFGMIVVDETHRLGAPIWQQVASRFRPYIWAGFSATPRRSDGLEDVLRWHIGDVVAECDVEMAPVEVRLASTGTYFDSSRFTSPRGGMRKEVIYKYLSRLKKRNALLIDMISSIRQKGRKTLVLSHFLDHLKILREGVGTEGTCYFTGKSPEEAGLVKLKKTLKGALDNGNPVGEEYRDVCTALSDLRKSMKPREIVRAAEDADTIFATYAMAREAMDIASLDTEVLALPIMSVEQPTGRIRRFHEDKQKSVVVDLQDHSAATKFLSEIRQKSYKRLGYTVKNWGDE